MQIRQYLAGFGSPNNPMLFLRLLQALRFPPNAHKQELEDGDKRRERQQQEQELAKHIAEEADGDF